MPPPHTLRLFPGPAHVGGVDLDRAPHVRKRLAELNAAYERDRLTPEQRDAVRGVRERVATLPAFATLDPADARVVVRFLRANGWSVGRATAAWSRAAEWRTRDGSHSPEALAAYVVPRALDAYGTGGPFGVDLDGAPVYVDHLGAADVPGLLRHVTVDDMCRFQEAREEFMAARVDEESATQGTLHWGAVNVLDLAGAGAWQLSRTSVRSMRAMTRLVQLAYPDTAKRILVVNAPWAVWLVWRALVAPFGVAPHVHVDSGTALLREFIAPDQIPASLGGTAATDGAADCFPPVRRGGGVDDALLR